MCWIMIDSVQRDATGALFTERFARVRVDVKPGKVTAGDIESDTMPMSNDKGSWIHLDREFHWLSCDQGLRVFERFAVTRANNTVARPVARLVSLPFQVADRVLPASTRPASVTGSAPLHPRGVRAPRAVARPL